MSAEFGLVREAVRVATGAARDLATPGPSLDWPRVAWLAGAHRVMPLVGPVLAPHAPDDVRIAWRHGAIEHAQRALHQVDVAGEVAARLEAAGVRALAVKGPALAGVLHGDAARRMSVDVDMWVARTDLTRAADCLAAAGWAVDPRQVAAVRRPSRFVQATVDAVRDRLTIELHGEAFSRFADHVLAFDACFARRRPVRLGARTAQTLGPADTLHYLCVHGDWHTWERLQWVVDVALAARACDEPAAADVVATASGAGQARLVACALRLARDLVGLPMPRALSAAAASGGAPVEALARHVTTAYDADAAILTAARRLAFHVRSRQGRARRHYLLWCGLTASAADVAGAHLPPRLSWLYPLWRVPGLIARHARATSPPPTRA